MKENAHESGYDGGRIAARGLRYQYLRTLESLLEFIDNSEIACVRVEGPFGHQGYVDAVDFDVLDRDEKCRLAVQVKSKAPGGVVSAAEVFAILVKLISEQDAPSYQLLTNGVPVPRTQELAEALLAEGEPTQLRDRLAEILANAPKRLVELRALQPPQMERLTRCRVQFDARDDEEILESLRENLRAYRNRTRSGLGQRSAGLLTGYLVSEIFRRASDGSDAEFTIEQLRSHLLINAEDLARASGTRDWGVIIGLMPSVPDVVRPALLLKLVKAFDGPRKDVVRRAVIVGLSGVGKSSLAASYVADRADAYDCIFWVDGEDVHSLTASFRRIARFLRCSKAADSYEVSDNQIRDDVHGELAQLTDRWAIVFDNVSDQRYIEPWIPRAGRGNIIITSIDSAVRHGTAVIIDVGVMDESEAVELLARRLRLDESDCQRYRTELCRLAHELSNWPLALELAAGYLDTCGIGLDNLDHYLERLKVRSLADADSLPPDYPRTLAAALWLCLERLKYRIVQTDRDYRPYLAFGVITRSAFLASRQMPIHMLTATIVADSETIGPGPVYFDSPDGNVGEIIRELRRFSLVSFDEDLPPAGDEFLIDANRTITTNSIVQDLIRAGIDYHPDTPLALDDLANQVERWLTRALDLNLFERTSVIFNHANVLAGHLDRLGVKGKHVPLFYGNLASACRARGEISSAEKFLRTELRLLEELEEPNELLIVQAKLSLVNIAFETASPTSVGLPEILAYLEHALQYAIRISSEFPKSAVKLTILVREIVCRTTDLAINSPQLTSIEQKCAELANQLGATPFSEAVDAVQKASEFLREERAADAEQACQEALRSDLLLGPIKLDTIRILVEALVRQSKWQAAYISFNEFRRYFGSTGLYVSIIGRFVHNVGCVCAGMIVAERNQEALKLLGDILDWPVVSEVLAQPPSTWSPRLRLLGAVRDLGNGDYQQAEKIFNSVRPVDLREGTPEETKAWCWLWQIARLATFRAASRVYLTE